VFRILLAPKSKEAVVSLCEGTVIDNRFPDHEESIEYALRVGFLSIDGQNITVTDGGRKFLLMNPGNRYYLTDDQKRFLVRTCYLQGPFREESRYVLSAFKPAFGKGTYSWTSSEEPALEGREYFLEQLCELSLLKRTATASGTSYEVGIDFVETISEFLTEGRGFTEEQFLEYLKEKKEVGDVAEKLALAWESLRLESRGHIVEASSVRSISKLKSDAGYDIESFNGSSLGIKYDRFIEVKGSKGAQVRFIWSDNEINKAKNLHDSYWIYFQGGIDVQSKTAKNEILAFQNLAETILNSANFKQTPSGLIIEADIRGSTLAGH